MSRWGIRVVLMLMVILAPAGLRAHDPDKAHEAHETESRPSDVMKGQPPSLFQALAEGVFDHVHNKLVHFPIALGLTAVLFVFLSVRFPDLERSTEILVWLAAVSALMAVIPGLLQEEAFETSYKHDWVEIHEVLGLLTTGSLFLWGFFFRFRPFRFLVRPWSAGVLILLSLTGAVGGVIAHG